MIQIAICVDNDSHEIEKQTNQFFKDNKDRVKYVDIKYIARDNGLQYAMIIYELIESDKPITL